MYISDLPINKSEQDSLGRTNFSVNLGKSLIDWTDDSSIVIGLFGKWGSGKSSVVNLACEYINGVYKGNRTKKPILVYFNPWNFSEQEKLITTFLHELARSISYTDSSEDAKKVGKELIAYSHLFTETLRIPLELAVSTTPYAPFLLPIVRLIGKVFKDSGEATKAWGDLKEKPLEKFKEDLAKKIKKLNRKIIVVIDDIDRLNNKEVRQIFQLVKQNANFPGLIYVLPFDRRKVSEFLDKDWYPGNEYLEKIVQVPFDIPAVEQVKLDRILFKELERLIEPFPEDSWDQKYWLNMYYGGLQVFFSSIRQIKRFANSLEFNLAHIPEEINPVDFVTLESIRIFAPQVYKEIWNNKRVFTELESMYVGSGSDRDGRKQKIKEIIETSDPSMHKSVRVVLEKLFPQIESGHTSDWLEEWNKKKRICSEERFDRYFLLEIPENEVSQKEIDDIVSNSSSSKSVETKLLALQKENKAKNFLEKLVMYKDEVPEKNILPFVLGVFNAGEKLPRDEGGMAMLDITSWCTRVAYHMLKRVKGNKERLNLTLELIKKSKGVDVLSHYISIEVRRDEEKENKDHEYIVDKGDVPEVRKKLTGKITNFAKSGKLISSSKNLAYILYLWVNLTNKTLVRKYVNDVIKTDKGLASIIEGFMWRQSSQTMGDYVSVNTWKINMDALKEFVELDKIKQRVASLTKKKSGLNEKQKLACTLFIEEFPNQKKK